MKKLNHYTIKFLTHVKVNDLWPESEEEAYRYMENLADAIVSGRVAGNFVEVSGESKEELYKEFFC